VIWLTSYYFLAVCLFYNSIFVFLHPYIYHVAIIQVERNYPDGNLNNTENILSFWLAQPFRFSDYISISRINAKPPPFPSETSLLNSTAPFTISLSTHAHFCKQFTSSLKCQMFHILENACELELASCSCNTENNLKTNVCNLLFLQTW